MAIDFDDVQDVSWSDIRKAAKYCLARGCFGQVITINGRNIVFPNADDCIKRIRICDEMEADEDTGSEDGIALVVFGERQ
jgi:hypothetical protein